MDLRIAEESRNLTYKRRFRIIFNVICNDPWLWAEVRSLQTVHVLVYVRVSQRSINFLIELEVGAPFAVAFYSAIKQVLRYANLKIRKDIVKGMQIK